MLQIHLTRKSIPCFTLIEMLVTLALLSILASLGGTLYLQAKAKARTVHCLANQHGITAAMVAYYEDHARFPADTQFADMAMQLREYIPWPASRHDVSLPGVYRCPSDRKHKLSNSYEPYYVRRKDPTGSDTFVLGCPRHGDANEGYLNTLGLHGASPVKAGKIRIGEAPVSAEDNENFRSMRASTMTFEDESNAQVVMATQDYKVTAVASFRLESGCLYSIVKVNGSGTTTFSVTPGSKFEVVTPVAIIGVRGTHFSVSTDDKYTTIYVSSGSVHVWDRISEKSYVLEAAEHAVIGPSDFSLDSLCIHCDKHCVDGEHCKYCPLHVGRPEHLNTPYCVECDIHSKPSKWTSPKPNYHCKKFCPIAQEDLLLPTGETDVASPAHVWPYW